MRILDKTSWDFERSYTRLREEFGDKLITDNPLANLNTFGTGGSARLYIEVKSSDELSRLVKLTVNSDIPVFLLGGGSNLLVSDSGFNGLVVKNSIMGLEREDNRIMAGAGEKLEDLINFATANELFGLEFASGIWGTVGGAIYGNAGAYGGEIGGLLESAEVIDRYGNADIVPKAKMKFAYRHSRLKESGEFVTRSIFALKNGKRDDIQCRVDEILDIRKKKLPYGMRTAGCIFKNIPNKSEKYGKLSAGKLLEEAEAKNLRVGDVKVFENHANILINNGEAMSEDIKRLADLMKDKVFKKFGIKLEEEIVLLGDFKEESL